MMIRLQILWLIKKLQLCCNFVETRVVVRFWEVRGSSAPSFPQRSPRVVSCAKMEGPWCPTMAFQGDRKLWELLSMYYDPPTIPTLDCVLPPPCSQSISIPAATCAGIALPGLPITWHSTYNPIGSWAKRRRGYISLGSGHSDGFF